MDGLTPTMRYGLAGGYQVNAENITGLNYCIQPHDNFTTITSLAATLSDAMDGLMGSPGHWRSILSSHYRKVNIGLAWNKYDIVVVQQFEGDYVQYGRMPELANSTVSISGKTRNGASFPRKTDLSVQVYYQPPPGSLTRGQLASAYCADIGLLLGALRPPAGSGSFYPSDTFTQFYERCTSPYDVPLDTPGPSSYAVALSMYGMAQRTASRSHVDIFNWIDASEWRASGTEFTVRADLLPILSEHGPGVYVLYVWADIDGRPGVISQLPFFHGVPRPTGYD